MSKELRTNLKERQANATKMKYKEVITVRNELLKKQGNKCGICQRNMTGIKACLDHCHTTGFIRGVLCSTCNAAEGKIKTQANKAKGTLTMIKWLMHLCSYLTLHSTVDSGLIHPTHKTLEERRVLNNQRARERRALAKQKD